MKRSIRKKNARLKLAGKPLIDAKVPYSGQKFDMDQWVLETAVTAKHHHPDDRVRERFALWNPPAVHCSECGFKGTLIDCGRTYFPPDDIGWDCPSRSMGGCGRRLVPGVDYQDNLSRGDSQDDVSPGPSGPDDAAVPEGSFTQQEP